MKKIIVVTGQTATGKTKRALELAKKHNGVLVNFDSRHVYKYLDIVSGKDLDSIKGVEFLLHSFVDPTQAFSSFQYRQYTLQYINTLKYKTFVFVGGTYLYMYNLLYGIQETGEPNWDLRNELEQKSVAELQDMLKKQDVQSFERLNNSDRNNPRRLIRKIEISLRHSGKSRQVGTHPKSSLERQDAGHASMTNQEMKFNFSEEFKSIEINMIGLKFEEKEKLIETITKRVGERIRKGAFEEVENLLVKGYKEADPGLQTIGYQQLMKFFNKQLTREQAVQEWITKEVQYAKRQLTFMKRDPHIVWESI